MTAALPYTDRAPHHSGLCGDVRCTVGSERLIGDLAGRSSFIGATKQSPSAYWRIGRNEMFDISELVVKIEASSTGLFLAWPLS